MKQEILSRVHKNVAGFTIAFTLVAIGFFAAYLFYSGNRCLPLSLSTAECANLGLHQYHVLGTFTSGNCTFEGAAHNISDDESQKIYESVSTYTIDFQRNALTTIDEQGELIEIPKIGTNTYSRQKQDSLLTYTFNKNGYILDAKLSPGHGCNTRYEMTLESIK